MGMRKVGWTPQFAKDAALLCREQLNISAQRAEYLVMQSRLAVSCGTVSSRQILGALRVYNRKAGHL